ncbi:MAG TPA: DUF488 domain-containing protein [Chloroflexia bacterium]|nr:DUF488 domain-containing protein [Chloroflexia bacterium]
MIHTKRVYEDPGAQDGARYLVERLWPRGVRKDDMPMDAWLKDVSPSPALREWYGHDVAKWDEFRAQYLAELGANPEAWKPLLEAARRGDVTLLYSARDTEHNSALVLKQYLEGRLGH